VPPRDVTFVVTQGRSSLDLYSMKLGERLPVPQIHTDLFGAAAETFGAPTLSRRAARGTAHDARLVRLLRSVRGPLHLPNHHFARYAAFIAEPYVLTVHDVIRLLDLDRVEPLIERPTGRGRMLLRLDVAGMRRARGLITVSEFTKGELVRRLELSPERIWAVPNGVDHDVFQPRDERPLDEPYVVFVGREQPRKHLGVVLRAFAKLKLDSRFARLKLVKIGGASDVGEAHRANTLGLLRALRLDEDDVVFTEWIAPPEVAAYVSGAECLVLPSAYEGFGLPPLEAMACGCPVVVSNTTALPEVVGDAGLLVDPDDPAEVADAIETLITDRPRRDELRERGLARAAEFSWERTATETLRVYERVFG
jgi:glycosyltransferase involved in cell wall biosynthesis